MNDSTQHTQQEAKARRLLGHRSIVIYGPQASGKTRNAKALAKHFQLHGGVVDGWEPRHRVMPRQMADHLFLTNAQPPKGARRWMHITQALARMKSQPAGYPY